jgi:hypothetical protein
MVSRIHQLPAFGKRVFLHDLFHRPDPARSSNSSRNTNSGCAIGLPFVIMKLLLPEIGSGIVTERNCLERGGRDAPERKRMLALEWNERGQVTRDFSRIRHCSGGRQRLKMGSLRVSIRLIREKYLIHSHQ